MKIIFKFLIITTIAIALAFASAIGPGHVIIFISGIRVDFSFTTLLLIIVLIYAAAYLLVRLYLNLSYLPVRINKYREKKSEINGRKFLNIAGVNYIEGQYDQAYANALKASSIDNVPDNKFLALMFAFKSALQLHDYTKEKNVLSELEIFDDKKWQIAKLIATAESHYSMQQYGLSLDNLNLVLSLDKKHIIARRYLLKTYLRLHNYVNAFDQLKWLIQHDVLDDVQLLEYKLQIFAGLFATSNELKTVADIYKKLDKREQEDNNICKYYFDALLRLEGYDLAIDFVKNIDSTEFGSGISDDLLLLAKKIKNTEQAALLSKIYLSMLQHNSQSSEIRLALGILCYLRKLYAEAKGHIETSLLLKPSSDGYLYLIAIAAATGNIELSSSTLQTLSQNLPII